MKLYIIRHAKVLMKWSRMSDSCVFDEECDEYDNSPIDTSKIIPADISVKRVYCSESRRSRETARFLMPDRSYSISDKINEVPLKSFAGVKFKLPLFVWNILGRVQWFFNISRQKESRKQTINRANLFGEQLISENENALIVTHGFFMRTLVACLKKQGFHVLKSKNAITFANLQRIEMEK